ncbi:hypothetical protein [Streptomyces mirabilis]|uniref:hypothetical protein n=1 Tax=Streptomyces mirabilis TaxID=68239 RepID=UPI003809DB2D
MAMFAAMVLWEGALWGAFGGFAMEALDYIIAVRRWRKLPWLVGASTLTPDRRASPDSRGHHMPEEQPAPGLLAYTIAGVLRVALGGGTAAAVAHTAPSVTAWAAVVTGAAAPMALEKITLLVPLLIHMGREGVVAALQPSTPTGAQPGPEQAPTALHGTAAVGQHSPSDAAAGPMSTDQEGV